MNQTQALAKLKKVLGTDLGYRLDPKAPLREEREAALVELKRDRADRDDLKVRLDARRAEILKADALYQSLKASHAELQKRCEALSYKANRKPITVGVSGGIFFSVRAEGDNWSEVVAKVTGSEA